MITMYMYKLLELLQDFIETQRCVKTKVRGGTRSMQSEQVFSAGARTWLPCEPTYHTQSSDTFPKVSWHTTPGQHNMRSEETCLELYMLIKPTTIPVTLQRHHV